MSAWAAEGAAVEAHAFYAAPEFWVAVAFVVAVAAIIRPFLRFVTGALDRRNDAIRERLEEAQKLREEAQDLLASFQRKQREAVREAEEIVEDARKETQRLSDQATADLEKSMARRESLALERIRQAELKARVEVRAEAADLVLEATRRLLAETVEGKKAEALVDEAIEELPKRLH